MSSLHGAILGMGAVVRAHPYSTPPTIKPMLKALCGVTSHNAELQVGLFAYYSPLWRPDNAALGWRYTPLGV